jgi:hypothetical protein
MGWQGSRYRTRTTLTNPLALGLSAFAIIERWRHSLNLSFYKLRRSLLAGRIAPPKLRLADFSLPRIARDCRQRNPLLVKWK